jgi:hypothetical protein
MSNLSDLLDNLGLDNSKAVGFIGNALGALADISGAGATLGAVMALFSTDENNKSDELLNELRQSVQNILDVVDQTNGRTRWANISSRWNEIDSAFVDANSVLDNLPVDTAHLSQLNFFDRSQLVETCGRTVEQLLLPKCWELYIDDPVYYRDEWNGLMRPDPDDEAGSVFMDQYVMPQLLRAITIYVAVLVILLPDDLSKFVAPLARFRGFLIQKYIKSKSGIRTMSIPVVVPPAADYFDTQTHWRTGQGVLWGRWIIDEDGVAAVCLWDFCEKPSAYYDDSIEYFQQFGAVHIYTGISSYAKFPPRKAIGTDNYIRVSRIWDDGTDIRFALASHARWKDVYISAGLSDVWKSIDSLRLLTGANSFEHDWGQWWTIKEIWSLVQKPYVKDTTAQTAFLSDGAPLVDGSPVSARALFRQLYSLYGLATQDVLTGQPLLLSLRAVLAAAAIPETIPEADLDNWWGGQNPGPWFNVDNPSNYY